MTETKQCERLRVPETCCGLEFGDYAEYKTKKRKTLQLANTVRGEMVIADLDAEGRIIQLELVSPAKPCQQAPSRARPVSPRGRVD